MNISTIINSFEKHHKYVDEQIHFLKELLNKEKSFSDNYQKMDHNLYTNDRVINFFADALQLGDSEADIELCELSDILKIYELLVEYYPDNIQYQEDLIAFVYNVMNDEEKTKQLIVEAMRRIDSKRDYLKKILSDIE